MELQLNTEEIKEALTQYIKNQGITVRDKKVEITLVSGKGTNKGKYTATVSITTKYDLEEPESISSGFPVKDLEGLMP